MSWALERTLSPEKIAVAERFRGGVIKGVTSVKQAKIAEAAGASAVMALERVPADIRAAGGVATPADAALMIHLGADGVRRLGNLQI